MAKVQKTNNMARKNGPGFKMKSSPTKSLFSNLFKSLKAKETGNIGEKLKKKYSSKAQKDDEVARPGESEYQFSVRKRKEKYKTRSKSKAETTPDPKPDPKTEIKGNFSAADTFKVETPKIKSTPDKKQTFKEAFAAARKAGKKTFTWKGNPYTTKLKEKPQSNKTFGLYGQKFRQRPANYDSMTQEEKVVFDNITAYLPYDTLKKQIDKKRGFKMKRKK